MDMQGNMRKFGHWLLPALAVCLAVSVSVNLYQAFGSPQARQARGTYITPQETYAQNYSRGAAWMVLTEDHFYLYDGLTLELMEEGEYRTSEDGQYLDLTADGTLYMQAALDGKTLCLIHPDGNGVIAVQHVDTEYVFPGEYPDSFSPGGAAEV